MPTLPVFSPSPRQRDLIATVFQQMLYTGTVFPRFGFSTTPGGASDFEMFHPLYGEFKGSQFDDDEVAAAFAVIAEVYEYVECLSEEGQAMLAAYDLQVAKWQRRSIIAWLRKQTTAEPDRSEIIEIADRIKQVRHALTHLANLFILLHEDIIAAEVFDRAVQTLDLENLIASPIEPIVIIDEPADEVPAETDVAAQPEPASV